MTASSSTPAPRAEPYRFPSYERIPLGAAYNGAPANYGKEHLDALNASSSSTDDADKGLTVFSPETFTSGGLLRVAKDRITPGKVHAPSSDALQKGARSPDTSQRGFQIWYEVHGTGPQKIVFIMGLNNSCFGWLGQVEQFARDPRYSTLVLDNRGYGNSETPAEYNVYKTSEMAADVMEVCDHLGWTEKRQLHVTGVSMGGMISLEIAKSHPERIASLSLLSTTSGQSRGQKGLFDGFPPQGGLTAIVRLLGGKMLGVDSDEYRIRRLADTLFPPEYQDLPSPSGIPGRKNRDDLYDMFLWRFHFTRRQTPFGSVGQLRAALTHRVTNEQLKKIANDVPSILVLTGDWDHLVKPVNSKHLAKYLDKGDGNLTYTLVQGAGHAVQVQYPQRLNEEIERNWQRGWKNSHKA